MHNTHIIIVELTIITILLAVINLFYIPSFQQNQPHAEINTTEISSKEKSKKYTLQKQSGTVLFKTNKAFDAYQILTIDEIQLEKNSWIKTTDGRATIIMPDKSIRLVGEGEEIIIK